MKSLKINLIFLSFIILFFSEIIALKYSYFSMADEIFAIISVIVILFKTNKKENFSLLIFILLLFFIGFVSNLGSHLTENYLAIFVDAFSMFKSFLIYLAFYEFIKKDNKYEKGVNKIIKFFKLFLLVSIIFFVLNTLGFVDMYEAMRYGLKEYKFIFINAGSFGYYLMALLPFFELDSKNSVYKYITLFLIMMTLKGPQMIFVILYIFFSILEKNKDFKKYNIIFIPIVFIIVCVIASYQINNYLINTSSARYLLTKYSVVTANEYFPLGSGFATYGSEMSRRFYSPLYYRYNFNHVYGLNLQYSNYINDNYWQMVLGQLGIFGFILNILFIFKFFKMLIKSNTNSIHHIWCKSMILCVLIGSIGSAYITGCAFAINILSLCILKAKGETNE